MLRRGTPVSRQPTGVTQPGTPSTSSGRQQLKVITELLPVGSEGNGHMVDITTEVGRVLKKQKLQFGTVTIFVPGSTAAVTTIEFEPGLQKDLPEAMEHIAPSEGHVYKHDQTWHDGNGHSHIRASIIGPSLTVPYTNGVMTLGRWQQIVLIDWDTRPRRRDIVLQFIGVTG